MKFCWMFLIFLLAFSSCSNIEPIYQDTSHKQTISGQPVAKLNSDGTSNANKDDNKLQKPQVYKTLTWENTAKVKSYCKKIDKYFAKYNWGESHCEDFSWHHVRNSHWGNPIMWFTFGDVEEAKRKHKNATIILCGVHGDEITPVKFCFDVMNDLKQNPQVIKDNLVVIAPIVTPDSFFRKYPTRTNGRGIDVNRNFPTKDWNKNALRLWKTRYRSSKRRYPGKVAKSEQETIFQINLIKLYHADKIISVHAPLTLLDYDGPTHQHGKKTEGLQLLVQMSNKAGKYRVNNYPFFTGSLGNWAGNERNIPTYTLELPNSDWTKTQKFYNTFKAAIHHAIKHKLEADKHSEKKVTENPSESKDKNDKVL